MPFVTKYPSNQRESCAIDYVSSSVVVDESKLDIYRKPKLDLEDWQPNRDVSDFKHATKYYLDIETVGGLDPLNARVVSIGSLIENSVDSKLDLSTNQDEAAMLEALVERLAKGKGKINALIGHNLHNFDIPFIATRCEIHGIDHPFTRANRSTRITASTFNGRPLEITQWYCDGIDIIDTFILACVYDKAASVLPNYRLKDVAIALKVRDEKRLELDYKQIEQLWNDGNIEPINQYLEYDLIDTKGLSDYFLPVVWYQQKIVPGLSLQALSVVSPALKWQKIIESFYDFGYRRSLLADPKLKYEGALTDCNPGLYKDCYKIDVSSMYPSIMLTYELFPKKDKDVYSLRILKYLFIERFNLKQKFKETGDPVFDQQQGALKILLNSCFTSDTQITTSKGVLPISDLLGSPTKVINGNGDWSDVNFTKYGTDEIWEVTFKRGFNEKTVRCTKNHKWLTASEWRLMQGNSPNKRPRYVNVFNQESTTDQLRVGDIVPHVRSFKPDDSTIDYKRGLVHGMIYGDGTHHKYKSDRFPKHQYTTAVGYKKVELEQYFKNVDGIRHIGTHKSKREDIAIRITIDASELGYPLKELPSASSSHEYILGFIRGLICTDGNVCKRDGMTLISGVLDMCEWVKNWGQLVGFNFNSITLASKAGKNVTIKTKTWDEDKQDYIESIYSGKSTKDCYHIKFDISSVEPSDLIRTFHRNNLINHFENRKHSLRDVWRIKSVEKTEAVEDVFCCVEQHTHSFVLSQGVLTKNCYGFTGVGGYSFNDMEVAALVTAYGRILLRLMSDTISKYGGYVIEIDTDGLICNGGDKDEIIAAVREQLPAGIGVDMDFENTHVYVPKRKSYLLFSNLGKGKVKRVGLFKKRNRTKLESDFAVEFISRYLDNPQTAHDYYSQITEAIAERTIDIEQLKITQNIPKNDVLLTSSGIGSHGDRVTYYFAEGIRFSEKSGKQLKSRKQPVTSGDYWIDHYQAILDKIHAQIIQNIEGE